MFGVLLTCLCLVLCAVIDSGIPLAFYFFDFWFNQLSHFDLNIGFSKGRIIRGCLRLLGLRPLWELRNVYGQFCSHLVENDFLNTNPDGVISHEVINFGVDPSLYFPIKKEHAASPTRIVYLGNFTKGKGLETLLDALALLPTGSFEFSAFGALMEADLTTYKKKAESLGLDMSRIHLYAFQPHDKLIRELPEYDILVFPSNWNEPYGLVPLEAMAAGVAVVATGDGGSKDFCLDGLNCLLFPAGNAEVCARQIKGLMDNFTLFQRLRANAREFIVNEMNFEKTVDAIEHSLRRCVELYRKSPTR